MYLYNVFRSYVPPLPLSNSSWATHIPLPLHIFIISVFFILLLHLLPPPFCLYNPLSPIIVTPILTGATPPPGAWVIYHGPQPLEKLTLPPPAAINCLSIASQAPPLFLLEYWSVDTDWGDSQGSKMLAKKAWGPELEAQDLHEKAKHSDIHS